MKKRMDSYTTSSNSAFRELMRDESKKTLMVWRCDDAIRPQLKDPRSFGELMRD